MKKVLFVATVVKTHMMQFHIPYLRMFQQMGWETSVAARNDYEDPSDCRIPCCDHYYDIPFERTPWRRQNLTAFWMLKKIIDEGHFDLIHCHTPVGGAIARLAAMSARRHGTKVVYTAHGFHFYDGAPVQNWLLFFPAEWLLSFATDALVTINREDYARAQRHMHAKRLFYVPGVGIDTSRFRRAAAPEDKRRELGCRDEDFLMLTVAEMTRNKNHITILRALALLKDRPEFENMRYLICGRGEEQEILEASVLNLGLEDHVRFLGYRPDAPALYRCSDLFLFMPFREGLSVALMEAMGSGLPIICTRIRGNTDLVDDGISGIFSQNDPRILAEHILSLYRDPARRAALGKAAAEKVLRFDNENVHKMMREIYLSVSQDYTEL